MANFNSQGGPIVSGPTPKTTKNGYLHSTANNIYTYTISTSPYTAKYNSSSNVQIDWAAGTTVELKQNTGIVSGQQAIMTIKPPTGFKIVKANWGYNGSLELHLELDMTANPTYSGNYYTTTDYWDVFGYWDSHKQPKTKPKFNENMRDFNSKGDTNAKKPAISKFSFATGGMYTSSSTFMGTNTWNTIDESAFLPSKPHVTKFLGKDIDKPETFTTKEIKIAADIIASPSNIPMTSISEKELKKLVEAWNALKETNETVLEHEAPKELDAFDADLF